MATLSSYVPAGTSSSLLYAVLSPWRVSSVTAHSGAQSPGQPTSFCSEPTSVAVRGASAACAVPAMVTGASPPKHRDGNGRDGGREGRQTGHDGS